jgi:hypothetical protein
MTASLISNDRIEMLISMLRAMRMDADEVAKLLTAVEAIQEEIQEETEKTRITFSGPFFELGRK